MIHVRRTAERASPGFEVVVREGKSETCYHVSGPSVTTNPRAMPAGERVLAARSGHQA
jgi:hypothetical protein